MLRSPLASWHGDIATSQVLVDTAVREQDPPSRAVNAGPGSMARIVKAMSSDSLKSMDWVAAP